MQALTTEQWVERASSMDSHSHLSYDRVVYVNQNTRVEIYCKKHQSYFSVLPKQHLKGGPGCPECIRENAAARRRSMRATPAEVAKIIKQSGKGDLVDPDMSTYIDSKTKMRFVCKSHGEFHSTWSNVIHNKHCCPVGAMESAKHKLRVQLPKWKARIKEAHGDTYAYPDLNNISLQAGQKTKINIECRLHGVFRQAIEDHARGRGCPKCGLVTSAKKLMKPFSKKLPRLQAIHAGKGYVFHKDTHRGSNHKMRVTCPTHGDFYMTPNDLLHHGCPTCGVPYSKGEKELASFVKGLGVNVLTRDRTIIRPKELDIVVPSRRLAIEYNGLYWHSSAKVPHDYHRNKSLLCMEKGYRLIHIWQDDWVYNRVVTEGFLRAQLLPGVLVYGRDTSVNMVNRTMAMDFIQGNHLQGSPHNASVCVSVSTPALGVVAVATFIRRGSDGYELNRYAVKSGVRVVGGLGKVVGWFRRNVGGKLVSFCDLSKFSGKSYVAAGFELETIQYQDYWFLDRDGGRNCARRINPSFVTNKYMRGILGDKFSEAKSKVQNMEDNGYYRVFSAGKAKYIIHT